MMPRVAAALACAAVALLGASDFNPVDSALKRYWAANHVTIPPPVRDAVFARRAWLDVWGLLPAPEELSAFERDRSPDKRVRLVETLLANRANYSEHWISFWNDLLRNEEGVDYAGERKSISPWLLKALADNLPYDRFVAALLDPERPEDPAGFLIGVNWRGDVSASQIPPLQAAQNSAQVFLGVNLKCNSCHDSFISRWKLKDAYGLASFFAADPLDIYRCDVKTGERATAKFLYPELGGVDAGAPLAERRAAAARLFTCHENSRFARTLVNRIWQRLFGRGIVQQVDDMDRKPWDAGLLDALADDFVAHGYDIRFLLSRIMTSAAYQLPAVPVPSKIAGDYIFRGPQLRRLTAEEFADGLSSITGEWRVFKPKRAGMGMYAREWRFKSSPLSRGLGRPIRDQVFTERNTDPTTLQALELANGETLDKVLDRGAQRMLGLLKPAPVNLFDSGELSKETAEVNIDVGNVRKLWLLLEDSSSYDPSRVVAGWAGVGDQLPGPKGELHFKSAEAGGSIIMPVPSRKVFDISNLGLTCFHAVVGVDDSSRTDDISPGVRFFVFSEEPDENQLLRVAEKTPAARPPEGLRGGALVSRLYRHALAREPLPKERRLALAWLKREKPVEGLEDLLWSVLLSPEFQYIQ